MAQAGSLTFTYAMKAHLLKGEMDLDGTSVAKIAVVTSSSNISQSSDAFNSVTGEIQDSGYTAGGLAVTLAVTAGTNATVTTTDITFTAVDGFTARYAVLYEVATGYVIGYATLNSAGTDVTVGAGTECTIKCTGNLITLS